MTTDSINQLLDELSNQSINQWISQRENYLAQEQKLKALIQQVAWESIADDIKDSEKFSSLVQEANCLLNSIRQLKQSLEEQENNLSRDDAQTLEPVVVHNLEYKTKCLMTKYIIQGDLLEAAKIYNCSKTLGLPSNADLTIQCNTINNLISESLQNADSSESINDLQIAIVLGYKPIKYYLDILFDCRTKFVSSTSIENIFEHFIESQTFLNHIISNLQSFKCWTNDYIYQSFMPSLDSPLATNTSLINDEELCEYQQNQKIVCFQKFSDCLRDYYTSKYYQSPSDLGEDMRLLYDTIQMYSDLDFGFAVENMSWSKRLWSIVLDPIRKCVQSHANVFSDIREEFSTEYISYLKDESANNSGHVHTFYNSLVNRAQSLQMKDATNLLLQFTNESLDPLLPLKTYLTKYQNLMNYVKGMTVDFCSYNEDCTVNNHFRTDLSSLLNEFRETCSNNSKKFWEMFLEKLSESIIEIKDSTFVNFANICNLIEITQYIKDMDTVVKSGNNIDEWLQILKNSYINALLSGLFREGENVINVSSFTDQNALHKVLKFALRLSSTPYAVPRQFSAQIISRLINQLEKDYFSQSSKSKKYATLLVLRILGFEPSEEMKSCKEFEDTNSIYEQMYGFFLDLETINGKSKDQKP